MLDRLVIGSEALDWWGVETGRPFKDTDYIATFEAYNEYLRQNKDDITEHYPLSSDVFYVRHKDKEDGIAEFQIAWEGSSSAKLLEIADSRFDLESNCHANPIVVLTLKLSHRYKKNSPHFKKTMDDIKLLRDLGYRVPECLKGWLKEREAETYNYKAPNLNQTGSDFFEKHDTFYVYNHDDIHRAVALRFRPAYLNIIKDGYEVLCDESKFLQLSHSKRLDCVLEEAYVLALERHQIPNNFEVDAELSFKIALKKICTSITSGWFREFAWENYEEILELYSPKYIDDFHTALLRGNIRKFDKTY